MKIIAIFWEKMEFSTFKMNSTLLDHFVHIVYSITKHATNQERRKDISIAVIFAGILAFIWYQICYNIIVHQVTTFLDIWMTQSHYANNLQKLYTGLKFLHVF